MATSPKRSGRWAIERAPLPYSRKAGQPAATAISSSYLLPGSHGEKARPDRFFLGPEDGGTGAVDHPPLDHDVQLVRDGLGELHVLLDQQDGDAFLAQQADHASQLAHD